MAEQARYKVLGAHRIGAEDCARETEYPRPVSAGAVREHNVEGNVACGRGNIPVREIGPEGRGSRRDFGQTAPLLLLRWTH